MKGRIGDVTRLQHMEEYIYEIERAIAKTDFEGFINDHVLRIAIVKWLEIIGEAANHISDEIKEKYAVVEWRKIVGLRNIVVHEYFRIDFDIIWDAATVLIPELKKQVQSINLEQKR